MPTAIGLIGFAPIDKHPSAEELLEAVKTVQVKLRLAEAHAVVLILLVLLSSFVSAL